MIHEQREIWAGSSGGPPADGHPRPILTCYVSDIPGSRPAVLICPGGGYAWLSPREGEPVALAYVAAGFHAFVLHYSVSPRRHPWPIRDLARALCLIRRDGARYRVLPDSVAVLGFSAGGHLAASLGVHWLRDEMFRGCEAPPRERRPDALVLCYPVITAGRHGHAGSFDNLLGPEAPVEARRKMSLELHVSDRTPPAFLWHTAEDKGVPVENTLLFAGALSRAGVPFELHVFPWGPHGLALSTPQTEDPDIPTLPEVAAWHALSVRFLQATLRAGPGGGRPS